MSFLIPWQLLVISFTFLHIACAWPFHFLHKVAFFQMWPSFRWRIGSCGEFSKLDLLPSSSMEFSSLVVTEHTHLHNLHTCSEMPIALHGEMCLAECPLGSRIRSHVLNCQLGRWNSSRAACPRLQCHTLPSVTSDMVMDLKVMEGFLQNLDIGWHSLHEHF